MILSIMKSRERFCLLVGVGKDSTEEDIKIVAKNC